MTLNEARQLIRGALTESGKVPTRRLRYHVLFRHRSLGKDGFGLQWEDIVRLDRNAESYWLICGDSANDAFDFFVVPHSVGRQLVGVDPLICKPAEAEGTKFKAATQNVYFNAVRDALTAPRREESVENYKNRVDLFEEFVYEHWRLIDEQDPTELWTKTCPACDLDRLPDYGTEKHDFQCRNGQCHLLWCGDYWSRDEPVVQRAIRQRIRVGKPHARGFWKFSITTGRWEPWNG